MDIVHAIGEFLCETLFLCSPSCLFQRTRQQTQVTSPKNPSSLQTLARYASAGTVLHLISHLALRSFPLNLRSTSPVTRCPSALSSDLLYKTHPIPLLTRTYRPIHLQRRRPHLHRRQPNPHLPRKKIWHLILNLSSLPLNTQRRCLRGFSLRLWYLVSPAQCLCG